MSYTYMFKFIIIGDTGTAILRQVLEKVVCCCSSLTNGSGRNTK